MNSLLTNCSYALRLYYVWTVCWRTIHMHYVCTTYKPFVDELFICTTAVLHMSYYSTNHSCALRLYYMWVICIPNIYVHRGAHIYRNIYSTPTTQIENILHPQSKYYDSRYFYDSYQDILYIKVITFNETFVTKFLFQQCRWVCARVVVAKVYVICITPTSIAINA